MKVGIMSVVFLLCFTSTMTKQTIPNILPSVRQGVHSKMSALSDAIELNADFFYFLNGEFHIIILGHVDLTFFLTMRSIVIRLMRFAPRAHWMVLFQCCTVLVSPCHVHTRRIFGMNVVELASWSAVDIIQDAV